MFFPIIAPDGTDSSNTEEKDVPEELKKCDGGQKRTHSTSEREDLACAASGLAQDGTNADFAAEQVICFFRSFTFVVNLVF